MKKILIAAFLAALTTPAMAGNLDSPWDRPPVTMPAQPELTWKGIYGGVGVTTQQKTTTNHGTEDTYDRVCKSEGTSHNGNKCQISEDDFWHLSETGEFEVVSNPWSKELDGPVIYDGGSYYGIWMNNESEVAFSTVDMGEAPTSANKPTDNLLVRTITDVFTLGEDEEVTANAFAGYRHVFASGLAGGLEVGSVGGAELQAGIASGRLFAYTGFNSDQEVTVGADLLIGNSGMFVGAKVANGESSRGEFRVGWKF